MKKNLKKHRLRDEETIAYDKESQSIIKLNNGMVLYLREVNRYLALVCILREDHFDKHGEFSFYFIFYSLFINVMCL